MPENRRHVIISLDGPLPAFKSGTAFPQNLEIYSINLGPDQDEQIDLALLNDLVTPVDIIFVGGGSEGKRLAVAYGGLHVGSVDDLDMTGWMSGLGEA